MTEPTPEEILESVAEEFTARLRDGETPSVDSYVIRYPALSNDIEEMLSSIALMERLSRRESDIREQAHAANKASPDIEKLGEFDIVREIGRGGMGIVYEAVDRSLQRRVALKVLNDSALTTQKHIDRFRRESRLAAGLHHTNIVSVFGVGEDNRKHFYAMQYIESVSVQDIINGLRHEPNLNAASSLVSATSGIEVAAALRAGRFAEARSTQGEVAQYISGSSVSRTWQENSALSQNGQSTNRSTALDQTVELSDATNGDQSAVLDRGNGKRSRRRLRPIGASVRSITVALFVVPPLGGNLEVDTIPPKGGTTNKS